MKKKTIVKNSGEKNDQNKEKLIVAPPIVSTQNRPLLFIYSKLVANQCECCAILRHWTRTKKKKEKLKIEKVSHILLHVPNYISRYLPCLPCLPISSHLSSAPSPSPSPLILCIFRLRAANSVVVGRSGREFQIGPQVTYTYLPLVGGCLHSAPARPLDRRAWQGAVFSDADVISICSELVR